MPNALDNADRMQVVLEVRSYGSYISAKFQLLAPLKRKLEVMTSRPESLDARSVVVGTGAKVLR